MKPNRKGDVIICKKSHFGKVTPGRRRCLNGHLIGKQHKTYCHTCWKQTTEKGKAKRRREKRRNYYKRRIKLGLTTDEANYFIVIGDDIGNQQRLAARKVAWLRCSKRYYKRWGNTKNFVYNFRRDMIREGKWTEEDNPL